MWGSLISTLPLGVYADKMSAVLMLQFATGVIALGSLAFPLLALYVGPYAAFAARFFVGLGGLQI